MAASEKEAAQTVGFFIRRVPRQFSLPAQMGFPSVARRLYIVVLLYHHTIYMSTYKLKMFILHSSAIQPYLSF